MKTLITFIIIIFVFLFYKILSEKDKTIERHKARISFRDTLLQENQEYINDLIQELDSEKIIRNDKIYNLFNDSLLNINSKRVIDLRLTALIKEPEIYGIERGLIGYLITDSGNFKGDDTLNIKHLLIEKLKDDKFIEKALSELRNPIIATWYLLSNQQRKVHLETLDYAIDYFSNDYDQRKANVFYQRCTLTPITNHFDSLHETGKHCMSCYDYKGNFYPDRKFTAQLERLMFKYKVIDKKRLLKWIRYFKQELINL